MKIHLYMNQCHDESEVWCDETTYYDPPTCDATRDVAKSNCRACLTAIVSFARLADMRLRSLRHEAGSCPIPAHADDCDCDGSLGDR